MHIIIAQNAGFCPGVNLAIEKTIKLTRKTNKKIYTLGQLIHNNDVIKDLEKKGIKAIDSLDEIEDPKNSILVIRAHGIPPQLENEIKEKQIEYIDATCPLVKKVHTIITRYKEKGYQTVILGDEHHAEVIGLKGYDPNSIVISSLEEAQKLPNLEKVNLVSQTTQEEELFISVAKIISEKAKELIISNTICEPTKNRQIETKHFSTSSDMVIVVGGKHSANTKRLYEICKKLNKNTFLIENESELSPEIFKDKKTVFITAGASTPKWVVEQVANTIKNMTASKDKLSAFLEFLSLTGITIFTTHLSVLLISSQILNIKLSANRVLSIASAITLVHLINRFSHKDFDLLKKRLIFFSKKTKISLIILTLSSIYFSLNEGKILPGLLFPIIGSIAFKKISFMKKIEISKKLLIAFAWLYMFVFLPSLVSSPKLLNIISSSIFVVALAILKSDMVELMYMHTDIIDETTKKKIFPFKYNYLLYLLITFISTIYLNTIQTLLVILIVFYFTILSNKIITEKLSRTPRNEAFVDLPFILLLAYFILI